MNCHHCGAPLSEQASFCPACGEQVGPRRPDPPCPRCAAPTAPGKRFCVQCGLDLTLPYSRPAAGEGGSAPAALSGPDRPSTDASRPDESAAPQTAQPVAGPLGAPEGQKAAGQPQADAPDKSPDPGEEALSGDAGKGELPAPPPVRKRRAPRQTPLLVLVALVLVAGCVAAMLALDVGGLRGKLFGGNSGEIVEPDKPSQPEPSAPDSDPSGSGEPEDPEEPGVELVYTTELAIDPVWADAGTFDEYGLARVKLGDYWGLIDGDGDYVVEPLYLSIGAFHEGLAVVDLSGQFGFIDQRGQVVVQPQFTYAGNFNDGLAIVFQDNRYGYINMTGELVIPCQYTAASSFSEGYAVVSEGDGSSYFIDREGVMASPRYELASSFSEGRAAVRMDELWGYIDYTFGLAIDYQFVDAAAFEGDRAAVRGEDGFFFIDRDGAVCSITADRLWNYADGRARVYRNGKYGYLGEDGELAFPAKYSDVANFAYGLAPVTEDGETWYYIDADGNPVIDWEFEEAYRFYGGLAKVRLDGLYGILDFQGNLVEGFQWEDCGNYHNGMVAVCHSGRWGYLRITEQEAYY